MSTMRPIYIHKLSIYVHSTQYTNAHLNFQLNIEYRKDQKRLCISTWELVYTIHGIADKMCMHYQIANSKYRISMVNWDNCIIILCENRYHRQSIEHGSWFPHFSSSQFFVLYRASWNGQFKTIHTYSIWHIILNFRIRGNCNALSIPFRMCLPSCE